MIEYAVKALDTGIIMQVQNQEEGERLQENMNERSVLLRREMPDWKTV